MKKKNYRKESKNAMKKIRLIISLLFCSTVLVGCFEDKIIQNAEKVNDSNTEKEIIEKEKQEALEKKQQEIFDQKNISPEQALDNSSKEQVEVQENDFIIRENYTDPNELAAYVANIMYRLQNNDLPKEEYISFIDKYASDVFKEKYFSDENYKKELVDNLYNVLQQKESFTKSYKISKTIKSNPFEVYAYRIEIKSNGQHDYYITTLHKKNNVWKFSGDQSTPPFNLLEKDVYEESE